MFTTALVAITKVWEKPKSLLIDEWTKKIRWEIIQPGNPIICDNRDETGGYYVK